MISLPQKSDSFFKEYGSNLTDERLISVEEYNALFKRSKQSTVFFDEKLMGLAKTEPRKQSQRPVGI